MDYYVSVFPNSRIVSIAEYPDESLSEHVADEHFAGKQGKVLTGEFILNGVSFLCLDGGPLFTFSEAISFTVQCKDQDEIDYYWKALSHVPESEQCGWCKDRFGLSWQIVPVNMSDLLQTDEQIQAMKQMHKLDISALEAAGTGA